MATFIAVDRSSTHIAMRSATPSRSHPASPRDMMRHRPRHGPRALVEAQVDERVLVSQLGKSGEQRGTVRRVDGFDERLQSRGRRERAPAYALPDRPADRGATRRFTGEPRGEYPVVHVRDRLDNGLGIKGDGVDAGIPLSLLTTVSTTRFGVSRCRTCAATRATSAPVRSTLLRNN